MGSNHLNWRNVTPDSNSLSLLVGSEEGGFLSLEELDGDEWENCGSSSGGNDARDSPFLTNEDKAQLIVSPCTEKKRKKDVIGKKRRSKDASQDVAIGVEDAPLSFSVENLGGPTSVKKQAKKRKRQRENVFSIEPESHASIRETKNHIKEKILGSRARTSSEKQRDGVSGEQVEAVPRVILGEGGNEADPCEDDLMDMSGWANLRLHSKLEKAISDLKFKEPTPIQRQCIPAAAHRGKDVIGAAETGSGKTLAFGLPILQRLLEEQDKFSKLQNLEGMEVNHENLQSHGNSGPLRALIVSPTRELALQICDHLRAAARWTSLRVVPIVGGISSEKQERLLKQKPEIIVGTPGRLWELMSAGETHLLDLHCLSFFVLDEADRMVEKGHFKELQFIIDLLPKIDGNRKSENNENLALSSSGVNTLPLKPTKRRQTLVFSATLALPADFKVKLKRVRDSPKVAFKGVESVALLSERAGVKADATIIDLTTSSIVAKQLSESVIECRDEDKDLYLYYILKVHEGGRTIVFCTSIAALRRVAAIMRLLQVPVWPLHAQMQQKARLKAMDRFRENNNGVLIATDVAARGLDINDIRTVVHYQLPHSAEMYVHRSGRTARALTDGISIALVSPSDRAMYLTLCRALSRPQRLQPFPVNTSYLPAIEKRVSLAVKLDKLLQKQTQTKARNAWFVRNAKEIEIDVESGEDDDERPSTTSRETGVKSNRSAVVLRRLQAELRDLIAQPVKPRTFSNRYITGSAMTPLLTKQLREYVSAKSNLRRQDSSSRKGKLVVIGQEQMEPLAALRLAASVPLSYHR